MAFWQSVNYDNWSTKTDMAESVITINSIHLAQIHVAHGKKTIQAPDA